MTTDFFAVIDVNGPRAATYLSVFGSLTVPIKSPLPVFAELPGLGRSQIVEIDIAQLDAGQKARLADHIAHAFHLSVAHVHADLGEIGCPIRMDDDVHILVHNPQRYTD